MKPAPVLLLYCFNVEGIIIIIIIITAEVRTKGRVACQFKDAIPKMFS